MPKIIFTSRYMRDAPPEQLQNYVKYIGTREGVEKIDESKPQLPATENQQKLIRQLLRDIPSAKDMLEYSDYLLCPTRENASELISCALEQNLDLVGKRENYVDYIANRPRVERIGEHGLFTDAGTPVILSQVQDDVVNHKGPVWTHVISLRREDAARLGYDSGKQWRELIRSKRAMLCKHMKIDSENLRWYCAFHNEGHHPHVHLMIYSAKDNDGFLTEPAIEAMRSELAHDIFRQDFAQIYDQQNQARSDLKQGTADIIDELLRQISSGVCENKAIEENVLLLSERLQNTGGKKIYGYLKADVKAIVDRIVDELAKDERVAKLYAAWGGWQDEIYRTYTNQPPPMPPLSQQKQFKSIKNMVIAEAMKIGGCHFSFEDESMPEPVMPPEGLPDTSGPENELPDEPVEIAFHAAWSERYKQARAYLYSSDTVKQNFDEAFRLFLLEAESGNALAMHDLGRMFADGLGRETDPAAAHAWYEKALSAFLNVEAEKHKPYLQYRIGKMYAAVLGTPQDYEQAALWFQKAVYKNHKYAQYSLAGLYYRGQGVAQDYETAFELYRRSADQGNPYADYEIAKMFRDGIGTQENTDKAGEHFKRAFTGFSSLEAESHDDKLQYRLGQMLYTGTGTQKDILASLFYFEKAAKVGNGNAQYMLGKLRLETDTGDPEQAIEWLTKAADSGNAAAQYVLAKCYRDGTHVQKDIQKAVELFTLSAEQKNEYAAYQLGRLYLSGEDIPKDAVAAVKWLTLSSDLGNQYAQYTLAKLYLVGEDVPNAIRLFTLSAEQKNEYAAYQFGKLYFAGEDVPKNVEAAIRWLTASAEQGNQYAQYALGKLYFYDGDVPRDKEKSLYWLSLSAQQGNVYAQFLIDRINEYRNPSVLLAATRLMHRLENLFREDYHKATGSAAFRIDRKRLRKLKEKKQAQGHARDDHEQQHQITL
jgi:hypothetical protein